MIIGICGGSGSGKTSILKGLKEYYKALKPALFSLDNYYLPEELQQKDENDKINFDLPSSLDREKIYADLSSLINDNIVEIPEYTFNHSQTSSKIRIEPSELIIVEGLFVFYYRELFNLLDFSVFVDVCEKTQLERRLERDMMARGYSKEDVLYQWKNHVLPSYDAYIEPHKHLASLLVTNDGSKNKMVKEVIEKLEQHPKMQSLILLSHQ